MIDGDQSPGSGPPGAAPGAPELEAVYRRSWPELVALARLLVDRPAEAEEVVQEAFVRTLAGWSRVRDKHDPAAFVRRAVVNLSRDTLRRRRTVRSTPLPVPDDAPGSDRPALAHHDRDRLVGLVRALPRRQRECVALRYLVGEATTAETASLLGVSEGAVKTHLHRGLAALRADLEDADHG